ncbi:MAG: SdrD B-like domain-containing protein [Chitinophagales bacterium]
MNINRFTQSTLSILLSWIIFSCFSLINNQSNINAQPNLLVSVSINNTTPGSTDVFEYRINYRCASITEHCYNSQITFKLDPSLDITNLPPFLGNVYDVTTSTDGTGTLFTVELRSPPSAGAPSGALAAGSTGSFVVGVRFKCEGETVETAGNLVDMVQLPVFTADDGEAPPTITTETATAPTNVTVPTLKECVVASPPPTSSFSKSHMSPYSFTGQGHWVAYNIVVPAHVSSFEIIDTIPDGTRLGNVRIPTGWSLEIDCGNGWQDIGGGYSWLEDWFNTFNIGDPLLDGSNNPTGCNLAEIGPFQDGTTWRVAPIQRFKLITPATGNSTFTVSMSLYADEDYPPNTYVQNCAYSNNPDWDTDCGEVFVTDKPTLTLNKSAQSSRSLGSELLTTRNNVDTNYPYLYKDPMDIQWQIQAIQPGTSSADLSGFIIEDLLELGLDFIIDPDKPNYWVITGGSSNATDPGCINPIFTRIPNYNGTGQTMLRWEFPNCTFAKDPSAYGNVINSVNIDFSTRYDLSVPLPTRFDNDFTFKTIDNSTFLNTRNFECVSSQTLGGDYDVPSSGGDLNSAKYVKGTLDNDFSRYPQVGNTDLNGNGTYEMYVYNHKFEEIKQIDLVDILPFINDEDLLSGTARGSDWSMELTGDITVERFQAGTGLIDASGDLGADGVLYSSSTNTCYLDGSSQIKIDGTIGEDGTTSCDAFAAGTAATGARSFAFRWSNTINPLTFGEYIKITVQVKQLDGEADKTDGEISWNSFGYTATQTDDTELLSTETIKVGLKMIDPNSFAALGNYIWHDENANGLQDIGEAVFSGITVSLYNADGTPVTEDVVNNGVTEQIPVTTTTDQNGFYCFFGLDPSTNYIIRLDKASDFIGVGALSNFTLTGLNIGDDALDSDAVLSNLEGLDTDNYPEIAATSPVAGEKDGSFDFGFYKTATVGDYVWEDTDGEGDQDGGEDGILNVTVELYDVEDNLIDTETTDADGKYLFSNVPPGTYYLQFSTYPPGFVFTSKDVTGNDFNDSDVNSDGTTDLFVVNSCDAIVTIDAGLKAIPPNPASISGTIWDDLDCAGGVRGGGDPAIAGVTVQLLDNLGFVIQTVLTDGNGDYTFSNIPPNETYNIAVLPPNITTTFTSAGADMDFNPATGVTTSSITPTDGQNITDIDAGLCGLLSLGNLVWNDANNDGLYNNSEGIFSNVTVYLIDGTDGTTYLDTTSTDANGRYLFYALTAGDYIIEVEIPNTFQSSDDIASTPTPNQLDSDDNGVGTSDSGRVRSNVITLAADGGNNANANFGESDHGTLIGGIADPTSDLKAYYTNDFSFRAIPCALSISNVVVSSCIDHPYMDVATVDVTVTWSQTPINENIEVTLNGKTEIIHVASGLTSPQTIRFNIPADGSTGNAITAQFDTETTCSDADTYDSPTACSSDEITCDILYLCSIQKEIDADPWDHGMIEYIDQINGTHTITPALTKADGSGLGLYDPNDDSQTLAIDFNDYDLIFISPSTEAYIAADLITAIKDLSIPILNGNYDISDELGMSAGEGAESQGNAHTDNTTSVTIYNFDNPNSTYNETMLKADYLAGATVHLWMDAGDQAAGQDGVLFAYDESDALTGIAAGHGKRVFLGYYMDALYANSDNGGALPAPASSWLNPVNHLTIEGKYYLDLALQLAADCPVCPTGKCGRVSVVRD